MNNGDAELRQPIVKRPAEYKFHARYCGTPDCGQPYSIQTNARSGLFISAATHIRGGDLSQTIVVRCVGCGCAINQEWADNLLVAAPEARVYRGGE